MRKKRFIWATVNVVALAAVVSLTLIMTGCASFEGHQYRHPCKIEGVTIELDDQEKVERLCTTFSITHDDQTDAVVDPNNSNVYGCANAENKRIRVQESDGTIAHEIRHLLERWCKQ